MDGELTDTSAALRGRVDIRIGFLVARGTARKCNNGWLLGSLQPPARKAVLGVGNLHFPCPFAGVALTACRVGIY